MFASGPVKAGQATSPAGSPGADLVTTYRVTTCELCAGDVYTVLPEGLIDVQPLRFVHASCVGF